MPLRLRPPAHQQVQPFARSLSSVRKACTLGVRCRSTCVTIQSDADHSSRGGTTSCRSVRPWRSHIGRNPIPAPDNTHRASTSCPSCGTRSARAVPSRSAICLKGALLCASSMPTNQWSAKSASPWAFRGARHRRHARPGPCVGSRRAGPRCRAVRAHGPPGSPHAPRRIPAGTAARPSGIAR